MIRAALLGAVLVHPIVLLTCFLIAMVFGAKDSWGGNAATLFGWQGGMQSLKNAMGGYLMSLGIAPLIMSAVGAVLGAATCLVIRLIRNRANLTNEKNAG